MADDTAPKATQSNPASAICMSLPAFTKFALDEAGFTANNFNVRESRDILSPMTQLETTYSIANRSSVSVRMAGDFVYLDQDNSILAALTANPSEWQVTPSMTTTGKGHTFVSEGTLSKVKTVCLRIFGTLPDEN
ncbi:hypothetical protein [Agrobacterium tumefaciens]|uniref:hypothetical protein n=1 Tax=Agrobacterium tumefaciens TaxID=358 RepID=UPI002208A802|nr:hypothetical protein FY128_17300 [Agrobacterium tumefaciens]